MRRLLPLAAAGLLLATAACQSQPAASPTTTATPTSATVSATPTSSGSAATTATTSTPPTPSATPATSSSATPSGPATPSTVAPPSATAAAGTLQLPRGGTTVFPQYRLVGWSGHPLAPGQGELGIGDTRQATKRMIDQAQAYATDRPVLPVMELIATTVHNSPGPDGTFRSHTDAAIIDEWLAIARENKAILLLNIQPGTADFLPEVKYFEKWLSQPDVGVALDPEWAIEPGQKPGAVFGSTTGAELDGVATYLAGLVQQHHLPEKVMVYHQLHLDVVKNEAALQPHPGVAMVKSVDGIGTPNAKVGTWNKVVENMPAHVHGGFKLFFSEDVAAGGPLMTPAQVLALVPTPDYVLYE